MSRMKVFSKFVFLIILLTASLATSQAQETPSDGARYASANFDEFEYRMVGPTRGGRVTAVAGHKDSPGWFLMGATGGGVWQTSDFGSSWQNVSDGFFATGSIGSIDVSDSNPDVIFVGTGSDGIRSNVIIGKGIYRSTDRGETWEMVGLENAGQIASVVIHPTNPEVVYAAAMGSPFGPTPDRGVYRTLNGGKTWDLIKHVSSKTGAVDIELHPTNPDIVYAAMWRAERKPWTIISGDETESGIYRSTDVGKTWMRINTGLPASLTGKIDFAVSADDPARVYALVEAPDNEEGLYRSNDTGLTWTLVSQSRGLMNRPFYYTNVDTDPSNADIVYVSNEGFYKSIDGGYTFERMSTPHGDNHDMWINPDNPDIFIQSNDGGANVTVDGGRNWSSQLNQPTAELYQVNVDDQFPYWLYAGQQDNTTIAVPSIPPFRNPGGQTSYWEEVGGCETGPAIPKPGDPNIVYSNCKGRFGRYNRSTGQEQQYYVGAMDMYGQNPADLTYRFQRVVPIEVSPHDPDVIYHGSQYVHRTVDEGRTWETISPDLTAFRPERQVYSGGPITRDITGEEHYSTLYVIEESPIESGVIWTGSNDGPVHVSTDNGETWRDVTPPGLPPEGRIQSIEPSPNTAGKTYIAAYRYLLDDWEPYIFVTTDYGSTWNRLTDGTNGIPDDFPTRVVREDPERKGLLYAGTEFGMFISFDDGISWQKFQQNLPVTPITDIKIVDDDLVVSTMGRSFWILDGLGPVRTWGASIVDAGLSVFPVGESHLLRYSSGRRHDTDPEYPAPGTVIDYFLGADGVETVQLRILDESGSVIRTFSSDSLSLAETEEQEMREPPMTTVTRDLATSPGFHRFTWDNRHAGPVNSEGDRSRGPLVGPGNYTVELSTGRETKSTTFTLSADPRLLDDGITDADLQTQEAFNLQVRDLTTKFWTIIADVDKIIEESQTKPDSETVKALESLRKEMVTESEGSYPPRMFDRQLSYLAGMMQRADQPPGTDAYQRLTQLRVELEAFAAKYGSIKGVTEQEALDD